LQFTGYLVDNTHIKMIESDNNSGAGAGATGGLAISQGSATGTFTDDTSFSGTYVFGVLGEDVNAGLPATLTSAGVFIADGSGNLTNGFTDTSLQIGPEGIGSGISASFGGKYSVDSKGTGRVQSTFNQFSPRQVPSYQPNFFFYLTGNGKPPLVLASGGANYPFVGAGVAYPQSASALTFSGLYGSSFTQQNGSENDGTAAITTTSNANPATLSGSADSTNVTAGDTNPGDHTFSGSFTAPSAGHFAGTFDEGNAFSGVPFAVDYYVIDSTRGFFVETDVQATAQVSFGYYSARTPACEGCP
jgi:hypothetical protein